MRWSSITTTRFSLALFTALAGVTAEIAFSNFIGLTHEKKNFYFTNVNIILFNGSEISSHLPLADVRAQHLLKTLRRKTGETFDVGLIDGPRGKGEIIAVEPDALRLSFTWETNAPPELPPLHILIGLPRPQTARDVLRDATTLGVASLHFVRSEKGEASYASSSLWTTDEWRRQVIAGATQAFCTRLPKVTSGESLETNLASLPASANRLILDNYESPRPLSESNVTGDAPVVLAIGSERGWSTKERELFRDQRFQFVHLGQRVLRTETAVVAAITLLKSKLGWL